MLRTIAMTFAIAQSYHITHHSYHIIDPANWDSNRFPANTYDSYVHESESSSEEESDNNDGDFPGRAQKTFLR